MDRKDNQVEVDTIVVVVLVDVVEDVEGGRNVVQVVAVVDEEEPRLSSLGCSNLEGREEDATRNVDCRYFEGSSFRCVAAAVVVAVLSNLEVSKASPTEIHSEGVPRSNPTAAVVDSLAEGSVEPNDLVAAVADDEATEEVEVETFLRGDENVLQRDFDNPMDSLPSSVAVVVEVDDYFLSLVLGRSLELAVVLVLELEHDVVGVDAAAGDLVEEKQCSIDRKLAGVGLGKKGDNLHSEKGAD